VRFDIWWVEHLEIGTETQCLHHQGDRSVEKNDPTLPAGSVRLSIPDSPNREGDIRPR
jgi:hypothetical protein